MTAILRYGLFHISRIDTIFFLFYNNMDHEKRGLLDMNGSRKLLDAF